MDGLPAQTPDFPRDTRTFIADNESDGAAQIRVKEGIPGSGNAGTERNIVSGKMLQQSGIFQGYNRYAKTGTRRGAQSFLVPWTGASGRQQHSRSRKCFGGADDGTDIAWVLQTGQDDPYRIVLMQQRIERPLRRFDQSGNALRRVGGTGMVEGIVCHSYDLCVGSGRSGSFRKTIFSQEYGVEPKATAPRFLHQMVSLDGDQAVRADGGMLQTPTKILQPGILTAADHFGWSWDRRVRHIWRLYAVLAGASVVTIVGSTRGK